LPSATKNAENETRELDYFEALVSFQYCSLISNTFIRSSPADWARELWKASKDPVRLVHSFKKYLQVLDLMLFGG